MADLSKLSDADLEAVASGDLSKVSTQGLQVIASEPVKQSAYESFLEGLRNPPEIKGRSPIAGAALAGLGGETLKNIGAATQLVSPTLGTPLVETGQAMVEGAGKQSPISTTVGQIGSYAAPISLLSRGANVIAGGAKTLPSLMAKEGAVGGLTGFLTTPGTPQERVSETVINAAMGGGMPLVGKGVEMVGKKIAPMLREAPTQEQLIEKARNLFGTAKKSGVELNSKEFTNSMSEMTRGLRDMGYDPRLHPKLAVAVEELTNPAIPKDFNELKTLRTFIQNAQKSTDPAEKAIATKLKGDFDAYIATMPESTIIGGSKEGLKAWKEGRDTYARLSKAEVFDDMLEKGMLDRSKYTQSGYENALANQLRTLAKNENKMRLFTPAEQEAIKEAAQGTGIQNFLRMIGKYTPSSPISTAVGSGVGAAVLGPVGAAAVPMVGAGARAAATKMRQTQVENLADLMRMGGQQGDVVSRLNLTPTQQNLARMLMLQQTTQGE